MGSLTRAAIVQRGLILSGCNPNFTLELNYALNAWLREMAMTYPWPIMRRRYPTSPGGGVPINQGATATQFGAGAGGITDPIGYVYDPIKIYTSDYSVRGLVRIQKIVGGDYNDQTMMDPSTNTGLPQVCRLRKLQSPLGQWQIEPNPIPDRAYLGVVDYGLLPADLNPVVGSSDDATVPWYENDRTMIALVEAEGHRLSQRNQTYQARMAIASSLVIEDRARYGTAPGTNDDIGLDEGVFRTTVGCNNGSNWWGF